MAAITSTETGNHSSCCVISLHPLTSPNVKMLSGASLNGLSLLVPSPEAEDGPVIYWSLVVLDAHVRGYSRMAEEHWEESFEAGRILELNHSLKTDLLVMA